MKQAVVIVGNGDFAKMLYRYMSQDDRYQVLGFVVEKEYISKPEIYHLPVIAIENIEQYYSNENVKLVLGIGYKCMGEIKQRIFQLLKEKNYTFTNYIHTTVTISPNVKMGEGNTIFENVLIQEGVSIGDGNLLYGNSILGHETKIGDFNSLSLGVTIAGCVLVEDNCFFGAASTIRDHIFIREHALIGAGAYCQDSIEPYAVLAAPHSVLLTEKKSTDFI